MMILFVLLNLALALLAAWDTAWILFSRGKRRLLAGVLLSLFFGFCSLTTTAFYSVLIYYVTLLLACQVLWKLVKKKWRPRTAAPAVCILLAGAITIWGAYHYDQRVATTYTVCTEKDASGRIVFLSDLHYPNGTSEAELQELTDQLRAQKADAYVLGGDIVDEYTSRQQARTVFETLGSLKDTAPVFYVYGNHDDQDEGILPAAYSRQELASFIEEAGITILDDESVIVGSFELIGREDYRQFRDSRQPVSDLVTDPEKFVILIDHQPVQAAQAREAGVDLMLSGHTHDGQLWPFGLMIWLLPAMDQVYGIRQEPGFTQITSSGIGGWGFPVRTAGDSEYLVIDIKKSA